MRAVQFKLHGLDAGGNGEDILRCYTRAGRHGILESLAAAAARGECLHYALGIARQRLDRETALKQLDTLADGGDKRIRQQAGGTASCLFIK